MPRKKENSCGPLPGFDIFEQPLPASDRGVLLKPHYRRKQLAGFVPLWNEFFRCYHLAGVSPNAVYLWGYLRQYEHERREWNAVSDISWPGRRDLADALGVSISHLPDLLHELRQARLISYQLVLPGFEDLAETIGTNVEEVRERAADYGVNPKVDGTLYRTSDPFTKTEFATLSKLKFCKGCKVYRYCDAAKEARTRLNEDKALMNADSYSPVNAVPAKAVIAAPPINRRVELEPMQVINTVASSVDSYTQEDTASVSKKIHLPNQSRINRRVEETTTSVSKKVHSPNRSRIKTNMYNPTLVNQPEISTTMLMQPKLEKKQSQKNLVVVQDEKTQNFEKNNPITDERDISLELDYNDTQELDLLLQFGFDAKTANQLFQQAISHSKAKGYIARLIQYARENARQNPHGMVRRLIERGEERLSRADRWQQQTLFDQSQSEEKLKQTEIKQQLQLNITQQAELEINFDTAGDGLSSSIYSGANEVAMASDNALVANVSKWQTEIQARIAKIYNISDEEVRWWNQVVEQLKNSGYAAASEIFCHSIGIRQERGRLLVILRNLFDQHRAANYQSQLERAVASLTGQLPWLELTCLPQV